MLETVKIDYFQGQWVNWLSRTVKHSLGELKLSSAQMVELLRRCLSCEGMRGGVRSLVGCRGRSEREGVGEDKRVWMCGEEHLLL